MDDKKYGYTTGSCAAAASKAALIMLLNDADINTVTIKTPKGIMYRPEILDIKREKDSVSCSVRKYSGDDPDITNGTLITAKVALTEDKGIFITGGRGIGKVTKPGLDQPVGEYAINSVPRQMIKDALNEVLQESSEESRGVKVTISAPEGEALAEKTFNGRLGIVGGISILGTTGIVEPMSDDALTETIKTEINVKKAEGKRTLIMAPGNFGISFLEQEYGIDNYDVVMCSNFVYDAVKAAEAAGFKELLFAGHLGKLIKVAGGIKNTHSRYGDHRMEILSDIAKEWADMETEIAECVTTDEAVRIINERGIGAFVFSKAAYRVKSNLEEWSDNKIKAEVIIFSAENKELSATEDAFAMLKER